VIVPHEDDLAVRRQVLSAAVEDLGRSVSANDQKASAALIVHGLLFAGIVSIAGNLGDAFQEADRFDRVVMTVCLAVALAAFLVSVGMLLWAIRPYRPPSALYRVDDEHPGAFFPVFGKRAGGDQMVAEIKTRVERLTAETAVNELSLEVVKLADILSHESNHARHGYTALVVEILAVSAFLVVAGINAA
jgi:hypothetical protein